MTQFGTTADGTPVRALTLSAGDLTATVLTFGAILQDVRLAGIDHSLTQGGSSVADYQSGGMHYHGAIVAPVGNRLTRARAPIAGVEHRFEANQNGRHILHSASAGSYAKHWDVVEEGPDRAILAVTLPEGEGGFPGTRRVTATFRVEAPATLHLTLTATTDAPTLMNPVNHSYWSLDADGTYAGQTLRLAADRYLPTDDETLPTGEIRPVEGTEMDFREGRTLEPESPAIDHNFCLSDVKTGVRDVLWLTARSGLRLVMATDMPGLQVFDGRFPAPGHTPYSGLALEAQFWPDGPNHAGFPAIELSPGETFRQETSWRFERD